MGFHTCQFCQATGEKHPATSSGDVTLTFTNGYSYIMPDMIAHYIEDHMYAPPENFVDNVTEGTLAEGRTKASPERVGYLDSPYFTRGQTTTLFQLRLRQLIEKATRQGERRQTRGI